MQADRLDREAFTIACEALVRRLEVRRKRFLVWWWVNVSLALILLVAGMLYPQECLRLAAGLMHRGDAVSVYEVLAFSVFSVVAALVLAILPIVRYRGGWGAIAPLQQRVWRSVCGWLGDAHVASSATSFAHLARESGLFPPDAGISERAGIKGKIQTATYNIQEMAVTAAVEGEARCIFRGLFLVCQLSKQNRDSALVRPMQRMLLLREGHIMYDQLRSLGWQDVVEHELELFQDSQLRCVITSSAKDVSMPDGRIWGGLQECVTRASVLLPSDVAPDVRAWEWAERLYTRFAERRGRPMLLAEMEHARQFCVLPALLTARQAGVSAFDNLPGAAFVKGGYRVAISCQQPVFGALSLFAPSVTPESMLVLYDSIAWMSELVENTQSLVD